MPLSLISPAFADGAPIPLKYSRDGDNLSPELRWSGLPDGTRSLALVVEDPDAPRGTFYHWGVYNVAPDVDRFPESVETGPLKHVAPVVVNDFGNARYDGPEPPQGHGVHHYHFRLYALDVPSLPVPRTADVRQLRREAEKHALAVTELIGTYER